MRIHFTSGAAFAAWLGGHLDEMASGAFHAMILHDDDCTPSCCICDPEIVVEELTVESMQRGAEKQAAWIARTSS